MFIVLFIVYLFCSVGGLMLVKIGAENNALVVNSSFLICLYHI